MDSWISGGDETVRSLCGESNEKVEKSPVNDIRDSLYSK